MSQRLITFKIDPALDRLWTTMGLTQVERAEESKKLEQELIKSYQTFIAEATASCEDLRSELREALIEYQHVQSIFGDDSPQPILNPKNSLRDQINEVYELTDELKIKYQNIVQEFEELYEKLQDQYQILRISDENQGEFAQIGEEDLTSARLERFKDMSKNLGKEIKQRTKLFDTLADDLKSVLNCVQEFPPSDIQEILDQRCIDNDSLNALKETVASFQELKEKNEKIIAEQWEKLEGLYSLLDISEKDQMEKPANPSVEAVDSIRNEITNLQAQADARIPIVSKQLKREIKSLCDQLRLPKKMRPKSTCSDQEQEVIYLKGELKKLQETQIKTQPIIDIICQLETLKNSMKPTSEDMLMSRERGASRRLVAEEKNKKANKEKMAKLEQKLLKLLVKYKEENGYDFEFEGVDLQALSNSENELKSQYETSLKKQDSDILYSTQKRSLGKALLLQKLNGNAQNTTIDNDNNAMTTSRKLSKRRAFH